MSYRLDQRFVEKYLPAVCKELGIVDVQIKPESGNYSDCIDICLVGKTEAGVSIHSKISACDISNIQSNVEKGRNIPQEVVDKIRGKLIADSSKKTIQSN